MRVSTYGFYLGMLNMISYLKCCAGISLQGTDYGYTRFRPLNRSLVTVLFSGKIFENITYGVQVNCKLARNAADVSD